MQVKKNHPSSFRRIYTVCFYLLLSFPALAKPVTTYFVSPNGSDSNNGTFLHPFRTVEKINSLKLLPNTTISFKAGAVFIGPLIVEADENGEEKQPIHITSYGKGVATIDGNLKEAIIVKGSHFVISDIKVKGAGRKDGNTTNGILIINSNMAVIMNVVTEGFQKSGIELNNCSYILLNKVTARDNGFCGIYVSGVKSVSKSITIVNCKADNNAGDPTNFTNHSGNGIFVSGSDSVTVAYSTATNNGWDMPRMGNGPVGIWGYDCDHLTIQYCISYKNKTHAGASDGGGFDFDGGITNSLMEYCLSYDNEGSGFGLFQFQGASLWSNNTIRYCVSINDGQTTPGAAGFLVWNEANDSTEMKNSYIHNNLVYNKISPAVRFDPKSKHSKFIFANNILIGNREIVSGPSSGEKFIGNIWFPVPDSNITFRGYKNLSDWSAATGQEQSNGVTKGKQKDPSLKGPLITSLTDPHKLGSLNGFKLQHGSLLREDGIDLRVNYHIKIPEKDFFGKAIKNGRTTPGIDERY